jgi:hypothetical protein
VANDFSPILTALKVGSKKRFLALFGQVRREIVSLDRYRFELLFRKWFSSGCCKIES